MKRRKEGKRNIIIGKYLRKTAKNGRKEERKGKETCEEEGFEEDKKRWEKRRKEGNRTVRIGNDLRMTSKEG